MSLTSDIHTFWYGTRDSDAAEWLTGEQPPTIVELREELRRSIDLGDSTKQVILAGELDKTLNFLEQQPNPATASRTAVARIDRISFEKDADRLYGALRRYLLCARLVLALKRDDNVVLELFTDLGKQIGDLALSKLPESYYGDGVISHALELVDTVFQGWTEQNATALETWDLLRDLLGAESYHLESREDMKAVPSTTMHVLGYDGVKGFRALLELEHLKAGHGYVRHPDSLLLPCDDVFLDTFETVKQWAKQGFEWQGKSVRWDTGAIRWRLRCPSSPQPRATGASIGGAIGAGVALLLASIPDGRVGITASIALENRDLKLLRVDLKGKIEAARGEGPRGGLPFAIIAAEQLPEWRAEHPDDDRITVIGCTGVLDAAREIKTHSDQWTRVLEKVLEDTQRTDLPHKSVNLDDIYVDLPMMEEIDAAKIPAGQGISNDSDRRFRGEWEESPRRWEEAPPLRTAGSRPGPGENEELLRRREEEPVWAEELTRTKRLRWEERSIEDVIKRQRCVIIGPPGSGKSTVINWIARKIAAPKLKRDERSVLLVAAVVDDGPGAVDQTLKWAERSVLPVIISLKKWKSANSTNLTGFLAKEYGVPEDRWERWMKDGDVLLLFDGLDEIPAKWAQDNLKPILGNNAYEHCPAIVSCRSIGRQMLISCVPESMYSNVNEGTGGIFTPSPLNPASQETYVRSKYKPKKPDSWNPDSVLAQLRLVGGMDMLAANPLVLSIICFITDSMAGQPLPTTRARLYDKAVDLLLDLVPSREEAGATILRSAKRRLLERVALGVLVHETDRGQEDDQPDNVQQIRPLEFGRKQMEDLFVQNMCNGQFGHFTDPRERDPHTASGPEIPVWDAGALLKELGSDSRILIRNDLDFPPQYGFLHRTFQEYLAACALCQWAEGTPVPGRGDGLKLADMTSGEFRAAFRRIDRKYNHEGSRGLELTSREAFLACLDQKCWLPTWSEVIKFLIGQIRDPVPVLEFLADRHVSRDALSRHRLVLAAECLLEIDPNLFKGFEPGEEQRSRRFNDPLRRAASAISTDAFFVVLVGVTLLEDQHQESYYDRALQSLGKVNAIYRRARGRRSPLLDMLRDRLTDKKSATKRYDAATALRILGETAARPKIVFALVAALQDSDKDTRTEVARALARMRAASKYPVESVDALLAALKDDRPSVRHHAVEALGHVERAESQVEVANALLEVVLQDRSPWVRSAAADALGSMPGLAEHKAEHSAIVDALLHALHDRDQHVVVTAARALNLMGPAIATEEVIAELTQIALAGAFGFAGIAAAELLGKLEQSPMRDAVDRLMEAVKTQDALVRGHTVEALGRIGKSSSDDKIVPQIVDALREALGDSAGDVRISAGRMLLQMGGTTARPEILAVLRAEMHGEDAGVTRYLAAMELGSMGEAVSDPSIIDVILQALDVTVDALLPEDADLANLKDEERQTFEDIAIGLRMKAAGLLGDIGEAAVRPDVLEALVNLALKDSAAQVRDAAVESIGKLGVTGHAEVHRPLLDAVQSGDAKRSARADKVIGELLSDNKNFVDFLEGMDWKGFQGLPNLRKNVRFFVRSSSFAKAMMQKSVTEQVRLFPFPITSVFSILSVSELSRGIVPKRRLHWLPVNRVITMGLKAWWDLFG